MDFLKTSEEILSVGEFSRRFKMLIKTRVPELWLRGEVSNAKLYSSGHTYFTLKDADASISAVLFKGYASNVSFKLRDGMKILVYGEISVYEVRGSYQIVVKAMMQDGLGDLARRFEELKKKLSAEGLFDADKKKSLPLIPKKIAVVTSPTGAAIRDFLRILERRNWRGEVFILPAKVQGAEAAAEISSQIKFADDYVFADGSRFDIIVAMRGGGSLEDLFAFNEEIVARAVSEANTPIISAVGHEIDFSLSDFAADVRAETPSAAAELISSSYLDCLARVQNSSEELSEILHRRFQPLRERLAALADLLRLNSPEGRLQNLNLCLDEIRGRLNSIAQRRLADLKMRVALDESRLKMASPKGRLALVGQRLSHIEDQLRVMSIDYALSRGFALVKDGRGKFVPRSSILELGENVSILFADGSADAKILQKK